MCLIMQYNSPVKKNNKNKRNNRMRVIIRNKIYCIIEKILINKLCSQKTTILMGSLTLSYYFAHYDSDRMLVFNN